MTKNDSVFELWNFFSSNAKEIKAAYDAENYDWLDGKLSPLVKAIAEDMNWEFGPYHHPDNTFVLSPTVRENLPASRAAVAQAPDIPGWFFEPAKPAKELLSLFFEAEGSSVCADEWRYRLTSYNSGEFVDIEIFYDSSTSPLAAHEQMFCELVVEAILGEELRLDRVGYLKPTLVLDVGAIENASKIRYLKEHLDEVLAPIQ
ncbi:hypothetical protein [Hydrogenophaga sp. SL48]|uniref:hypothetical protein n=1 Tax=Hydrogenophaga sp. SL48 TaxID=2806347 RepID=UPI001F42D040|nr:hypothetical protein [Hydrogenophaga sp. SL48]UJW81276.1 hypothetical protein IM738_00570 [Hydrogenophaga sp. SL48]